MYDVVEEFIKFRLDAGFSISMINNEIQRYAGRDIVYISPITGIVEREVKEGRPGHFGIFTNGVLTVKYMKEWGEGVQTNNFTKFREGVSKTYPHFKIDRIK